MSRAPHSPNFKSLIALLVLSVGGGLAYSDYGVPGAVLVIPFLIPVLLVGLAFISSRRAWLRLALGAVALGLFDVVRWFAWVNEVGTEFAINDERTFGIARTTAVVHLLLLILCFCAALAWERIGKVRKSNVV